jgi:hypothetical protein
MRIAMPLYFCGGAPSEPRENATTGERYSSSSVCPGATLTGEVGRACPGRQNVRRVDVGAVVTRWNRDDHAPPVRRDRVPVYGNLGLDEEVEERQRHELRGERDRRSRLRSTAVPGLRRAVPRLAGPLLATRLLRRIQNAHIISSTDAVRWKRTVPAASTLDATGTVVRAYQSSMP